ncbi:OLC1v1021029C2 [Oldenlandia corymbosa var. corymbosa]|uniref:OLC1v1021029C2 n=1 Tax=Oldenlandia corymbosa var. corymbosa TaxID=529605 RepID=A0AAV1BX11_OLDCO|nr:OLC1v1021029C2 [Oldenlandia corymbosa var. corymbosa]
MLVGRIYLLYAAGVLMELSTRKSALYLVCVHTFPPFTIHICLFTIQHFVIVLIHSLLFSYCMREMLDKVPLGDWLCEECKLYAEMNGRDLEIVGSVDGIEKTRSSGPVDPESLDVYKKFETGVSDVDQKNNYINFPSAKILGKRQSNDSQVSSPAKRHALEPENVSGNKSITNGEPAISRNSSMKLDRLKTKTDHSSNSPISAPESADLASASRLQAQGTFAKSNSFNSLNVKSKVNLLDDVIPQKQRSTRESVSSDRKEGISRSMSKSMSFKTPYGARANIGESKVKMLSPKFSHLQDTKGSKNSKDCKVFERKNSFQLERSSLANSGSHAAKNDRKIVSSGETNSLNPPRKFRDAKAVTSDRRSTILSKSPSFATRKGLEPVSLGEVKRQSTTGLVGISSAKVPKPNQDNLKVDTSSSNCSAELSSCYANEGSLDDLSQQIESTDSDERAKDGLSSRLREGVDSKDKLKAAIEAAMLRKPGIYQKHRQPSHCSDVSAVSAASKCETAASHVLMSGASNMENVSLSFEEKKMILGSSTSDFYKRETLDDAKQIALVTCEASTSSAEESPPFGPLEGLSLAIPDNDYIWNGAFEVQRVGRNISLFDGIQAHLSASASPKVLEAVNKFNNKVVLNEVPRLKTWPVQFQENGVGEDNIAIFFFAKDSASYEKSYKGLLNNMMKNDVALKGNFGGFELMIFPSNQLPEKCQRWNTMFFMWGVFRGKRVNQRQVPGSDEKTNAPQDVIMASMTSPVNISLGMPIDIETRALGLTSLSSSEALRGLSDCRLSSDIMDKGPLQTDNVLSDSRQNLRPFSVLHPSVAKSCVEKADISRDLSRSSISLQEQKCCIGSDDKKEPEVEIRVESAIRDCDLNESPQKLMNYHPDFNQQQLSSAAGSHEMSSAGDRISLDGASLEGNLADGASPGTGNQMVDDKFTEVASEPASLIGPGTATGDVDLEEVRIAKKQKTDCYGGLYGENGGQTSTSKDSVLHSDCLSLANGVDEISSGSYFFPVQPKEEVGQVRRLMQSSPKIIDLEEDIAPNLELALGAESKTSPALPFLVEKDDKKFTWHLSSTPEQTATTKGRRGEEEENDVVSASLSLSLSFPFPEKEEETTEKKPSLGSEAGNVNTSLLLFGLEGQVENRIPSSLQYPGGNTAASQACNRFK